MSETIGTLARRAEALRRDFDRSFAEPVRDAAAQQLDFLAIRIGAEACALRLSEIAGLHADRKITPVPGGHAASLGIAGFRGTILPVYGLRALLGTAAGEVPRWLVVAAGARVALAFEGFEGHLRVAAESILQQPSSGRHRYASDYLRARGTVRPIIDLPSVLAAIATRGSEAAPQEEN